MSTGQKEITFVEVAVDKGLRKAASLQPPTVLHSH
jgi:hypothetical protein